ncbi:16847_t:CDS:2 [Cetraspora pellucida]|uniref:16847_t:CDS:1 n=1 Tax=Cetraspora pellucida TaxID=1433469 RepID=A0A9N9BZW7_9GLOM|nr:16847_t:CDS:2 [Cetraspora pellucida]
MVKLEVLSLFAILLLCASNSFAGVIPSGVQKSIGNYEFPKDIKIPENITVPEGNCFKFYLYVSGYIWYQCTNSQWEGRALFFNHEEDIPSYPISAVVSTYAIPASAIGIRSIIPESDSSSLVVTSVATFPPPNPEKDLPYGLEKAQDNKGEGVLKDITYVVRVATDGGGTKYPEGYIYSSDINALNLFYHPQK